MKWSLPGIRLGATSFLLHAEYVPAVRFAAERCDDVAVLLTETGKKGEWLPARETMREVARIAAGEGATLHVHLPTDGDFASPDRAEQLFRHVQMAMERAEPLGAHTFVLHVDFPDRQRTVCHDDCAAWTLDSLRQMLCLMPCPEALALENLEGFSPLFWDRWVEQLPCSRCFDIGHIWKDGGNPVPLLEAWLSRIRVIHLHGLAFCGGRIRDHRSLAALPQAQLDAVLFPLWASSFAGVLTLEVFSVEAFQTSYDQLILSYDRFMSETNEYS